MFRCTDCYKEYPTHPGYCECGNDQFEEIIDTQTPTQQEYADNQYYEDVQYDNNGYTGGDGYSSDESEYNDNYYDEEGYEEEYVPPVPKLKRRKVQPSRKKSYTLIDKIGLGVFILCIILSILAFIFIGSGKKSVSTDKNGKPLRVKNYSIPVNIDTIWNSTPPKAAPTAAKVDPSKILNSRLSSLDSEMNSYLIGLAQAMIDSWIRDDIKGDGSTQMEFMVAKDGKLVGKKIYKYSGNKSLDDSIGMLISSFSNYQIPPSSYNQEIIIIQFSSNNGSTKASFPNIKGQ